MRRASFDNVQVNVICLPCGTEHHKPLGWFREHSRLTCDGCGYEIALHNERLRAEINELRPVMLGLRRSSRTA
jgi:transposase-like protein